MLLGLVCFSFYLVSHPEWPLIYLSLGFVFIWIMLPTRLEKRFLGKLRSSQKWEQSTIPRTIAFLLLEGEQNLYRCLQRFYVLIQENDLEKFRIEIQRVETQQKDQARFYAEVLDLFRMARRYSDGIVFFEERQEKIPPSESLFFTLCRLYAEVGQLKKSHFCLQQLEALPHSEYLRNYILMGYMVFYALSGAKGRFIQLLAEYPQLIEVPFFLHWKGVLLIRSGAEEEGEQLLKNFHEKNQKNTFMPDLQRYFQPEAILNEEVHYANEVLWKKIVRTTLPSSAKKALESWLWIGILSGFNLAIFFYFIPINNMDFMNLGALTSLAFQGEPFRLIASAFLHGGWLHFLSNLFSLFVLAAPVEMLYRRFQMTGILIFSIVTGNLLSLYQNPEVLSIGISGGVCGLFGAFLVYHLSLKRKLPPDLFKRFVFISLILFGLMSYMGYSIPQINNWAHLGGLIGGSVLAIFLKQWNQKISERKTYWIFGVLVLFTLIGTAWGWLNLLISPYPKPMNYQEKGTTFTQDKFVFELPRGWTLELFPTEKTNSLNPNEYQIKPPHSFSVNIMYTAYPYPLPKNFFENEFQFIKEETFESWTVQHFLYRDKHLPMHVLYFFRSYGFRTCNLYYVFNGRFYPPDSVKNWISPLLKHITPE